jgi:hypothetical protein
VEAVSASTFRNCAQLNAKYPKGIASSSAAAKKQKLKPSLSAALYKKYSNLDSDKDGTACEVDSLKPVAVFPTTLPLVVATSTTSPSTTTTLPVSVVPTTTAAATMPDTTPTTASDAPVGASAKCRDGSYSFSKTRSGTCSGHGGVSIWL